MSSQLTRLYSYRIPIFLSVLAIIMGGSIYLFLRPAEVVFFEWIRLTGPEQWLSPVRTLSTVLGRLLPDWIVFSLPNGLWAFAYALLITRIWSRSQAWLRYLWMASIPVLVLGFEILQLPGIIRGTFCVQDIALGVTGMALGILVGNSKTKNNNYHEKTID